MSVPPKRTTKCGTLCPVVSVAILCYTLSMILGLFLLKLLYAGTFWLILEVMFAPTIEDDL